MYKLAAKILILFFVSGALSSPVSEEVSKKETGHGDKDVKEIFGGSVAVPAQVNADEGIQIPVHVIHEVREAKNIETNDVNDVKISHREEALVQKLNSRCSQGDLSTCVMLKLVTYMNRLLKKNNIEVYDGVQITQSSTVVVLEEKAEDAREDKGEDSQAMELITDKVWSFVKSRSLRWNILGDADVVLSTVNDDQGSLKLGVDFRSSAEKGTGRGKKNNLGPILAAAAMKAGILGALAFKGLALLIGKALLISKIALLLAAVIGLKKLFSHEKHVTYEVVANPHHSHSHGHSASVEHGHEGHSSGWGRSIGAAPVASGEPHNLAYSAHAPQ